MKRTSVYFPMRWAVMCKPPGQHFFEPIATFNHDRVASQYAMECRRNHPVHDTNKYAYRVDERNGRGGWTKGKEV